MESVVRDVLFAFRSLKRQPAFAITAVLTIALGIGATSAIFSVVNAVLLRPLPYTNASRLGTVWSDLRNRNVVDFPLPAGDFYDLRKDTTQFDGFAAITSFRPTVGGDGQGEAEQVSGGAVTTNFFSLLGHRIQVGRDFIEADGTPNAAPPQGDAVPPPGAQPPPPLPNIAIISYEFWQRRFGGNESIVGQSIPFGNGRADIVGVLAPRFEILFPPGTNVDPRPDILVASRVNYETGSRNNVSLRVVTRLKPGVSFDQAQSELDRLSADLRTRFPIKQTSNMNLRIEPMHDDLVADVRPQLVALMGAVVFVLLIACANVANLLLARSVSRARELSIRAALGAGRIRLVRQLLTESLVLSAAGGIVGVLLASWLLRVFLAFAPANFAGVQAIGIDTQVLLVTVAVAMITGLLFGLAPARHGFQVDPNDSLRDTGTRGATSAGARGASRVLVVAEIALAMVLVIGAGLMVKSLLRLEAQDPGFRSDGVMTFQLNLPAAKYPSPAQVTQAVARVVSELQSIPAVASAGAINMIPLTNFGMNGGFSIVGRPPFQQQDRAPVVEYRVITPGYFGAMGIPIRRGSDLTGLESATGAPVVIINETMANQFWPNANPVGERLQLAWDPQNVTREIVGVAGDARSASLNAAPVPEAYVPHIQAPVNGMGFVMRTQGVDPVSVLPAARQRVAAIDADLPIVRPQTLETVRELASGGTRLSSVLTSVFALLAALLASVGIYSLIAYSVAERTRELGIRVALGADRRAVVRLIVGEGLRLAAIGIAIGLAGSWMLTGTLRTLLFEVSPIDPAVIAMTCGAVLVVTGLASYIPARRALRVDPMAALRAD